MRLHHLRPAPGARRARTRVGRGRAAGKGKTAGRGTKGYLARHTTKLGFEGGQLPLVRRVPKKRGFTPRDRERWAVVNVARSESSDSFLSSASRTGANSEGRCSSKPPNTTTIGASSFWPLSMALRKVLPHATEMSVSTTNHAVLLKAWILQVPIHGTTQIVPP